MPPNPTSVQVPVNPGPAQALVDNNLVATGAGNVVRQVVTPGDPSNASNYQFFDNNGNGQVKLGPGLSALLSQLPINLSASGAEAIIPGVSGKVIRIYRMWFLIGAPTNIILQDGTNNLTGSVPLFAGGGIALDYSGEPWYIGTAGQPFNINSSNAVQIGGTVYYVQA